MKAATALVASDQILLVKPHNMYVVKVHHVLQCSIDDKFLWNFTRLLFISGQTAGRYLCMSRSSLKHAARSCSKPWYNSEFSSSGCQYLGTRKPCSCDRLQTWKGVVSDCYHCMHAYMCQECLSYF